LGEKIVTLNILNDAFNQRGLVLIERRERAVSSVDANLQF